MQFSQTNSNTGNVNNAVAEKGIAIQATGAGNKVQVQKPKGSRQSVFWELVTAPGTGAFESRSTADGGRHGNLNGGDQVLRVAGACRSLPLTPAPRDPGQQIAYSV